MMCRQNMIRYKDPKKKKKREQLCLTRATRADKHVETNRDEGRATQRAREREKEYIQYKRMETYQIFVTIRHLFSFSVSFTYI